MEERFAAPGPGRGRLTFRLVLGMTELAGERVGAVLAACSAVESPADLEPATEGRPLDLRHAAVGMLSDVVAGVTAAPALVRARWRQLAASARRRVGPLDRLGGLVGRLPGVPRARGRFRGWRSLGWRRLARWAELGRREEAASRLLASDALAVLRENVLARISESPDLKSVIREQSEGIAVTAMSELRERSARADNLAERTVGRFFGGRRAPRSR
jgi:hypothetical protein